MVKVKLENIMQSWEVHISGMASQIEAFYGAFLEEWNTKETGIEVSLENVGSLFGKKKRMVTIEWNRYRCYVGAEVFGSDLFCTWHLYHPDFNSQETVDSTFLGLFLADFNELSAIKTFAAVSRDCAVKAAERLFDESDLDKGNLKRPSSGVLGPL